MTPDETSRGAVGEPPIGYPEAAGRLVDLYHRAAASYETAHSETGRGKVVLAHQLLHYAELTVREAESLLDEVDQAAASRRKTTPGQ